MNEIHVEVLIRIPCRVIEHRRIEMPGSFTVEELLKRCSLSDVAEELFISFNGKVVFLDDDIRECGMVVILPRVCGG